jgi:phosphoribosylformimino-5-aminoimidazole carboxamide ribotide isomerase
MTLSKEVCGRDKCSDQVVIAIDVLDEVIKYSGWMESSPIKLMDYVDKCLALRFLPLSFVLILIKTVN